MNEFEEMKVKDLDDVPEQLDMNTADLEMWHDAVATLRALYKENTEK